MTKKNRFQLILPPIPTHLSWNLRRAIRLIPADRHLPCHGQNNRVETSPPPSSPSPAMARISNGVVGALNLLTLLASLAAIGAALWLRLRGGATDCERVLLPLPLALGSATLVASALGLVAACFRSRAFLWVYLALLFVVIVAAVAFTVAVLVVTHRGAVGRKLQLPGHIKEHRLRDFSHWLAKRVRKWKNWIVIESCLKESGSCRRAAGVATSPTDADFYDKLSPIQVRLKFTNPTANIYIISFCSLTPLTTCRSHFTPFISFPKCNHNFKLLKCLLNYSNSYHFVFIFLYFLVWLLHATEVLQVHVREHDDVGKPELRRCFVAAA